MVKPSVLNIGLDASHPMIASMPGPHKMSPEQVQKSVDDTRIKMKELGYEEFKSAYLNPDNHVEEFTALIKEKSWNGLVIGGGFKMIPALNRQLEDVINITKDISPKTRILFSLSPAGVPEAAKRLDE